MHIRNFRGDEHFIFSGRENSTAVAATKYVVPSLSASLLEVEPIYFGTKPLRMPDSHTMRDVGNEVFPIAMFDAFFVMVALAQELEKATTLTTDELTFGKNMLGQMDDLLLRS